MGAHHDHSHCHAGASKKRIAIAAILTGLFMVVEVAGGLISGSLALLADAGHMLTDFAALSLAWLAFHLARRAATTQLTFGFERLPVLAAFVNGITLFAIAIWIVIEALHRFRDPGQILAGTMLYVAAAGLAVNIVVFLILRGADRNNLNVRGALLHVMGDMLGSAAAIIAAIVIMKTGYMAADPILSVLVALLILRSAWVLIKESGHILLEGAPTSLNRDTIMQNLSTNIKDIQSIDHMHIWSLTDGKPMMSLEVIGTKGADRKTLGNQIRQQLCDDYGLEHVTLDLR